MNDDIRLDPSRVMFAFCERCKVLWLDCRGESLEHECRGWRGTDPEERISVPTVFAHRSVRLIQLKRREGAPEIP